MRPISCLGALVLAFVLCSAPAMARKKQDQPSCTTKFSVVAVDKLKNVTQGLPDKDAQWFQKKIEKQYPDVCYAPPAPDVPIVFLITVAPAEYNGTRIVRNESTQENPVSGTLTDEDGNTSEISGTETTTTATSTAVPYNFEYGIFTLAIETKDTDGKWMVRHRFQQSGIYNTLYGIPLGGRGHHPVHAVIEDAAKWVHEGGLTNPLESAVAPQ